MNTSYVRVSKAVDELNPARLICEISKLRNLRVSWQGIELNWHFERFFVVVRKLELEINLRVNWQGWELNWTLWEFAFWERKVNILCINVFFDAFFVCFQSLITLKKFMIIEDPECVCVRMCVCVRVRSCVCVCVCDRQTVTASDMVMHHVYWVWKFVLDPNT